MHPQFLLRLAIKPRTSIPQFGLWVNDRPEAGATESACGLGEEG
ncbi:MAG TPA: hypothetical protein VM165_23930 [Planctomycetaceae bacterium]|nr:hypothetical protein [Planctomycetaceae bacterium]